MASKVSGSDKSKLQILTAGGRTMRSDSEVKFSGNESTEEQLIILTNQINQLKVKTKQWTDKIEKDLDLKISQEVETAVSKLGAVNQRTEPSESTIENIKTEIYNSLSLDLEKMVKDKFCELDRRLKSLEKSVSDIDLATNAVKASVSEIKGTIDNHNETLAQASLGNQLIFFGLEEDVTTNTVIKENVENKLMELCAQKFPGIPLDASDIVFARRIGRKVSNLPRPTVVTLSNLRVRSQILKNRKQLKGSRMSVTECLTKTKRELFAYAKTEFGLKNVWTTDGNVMVKTGPTSARKVSNKDEIIILKRYLDTSIGGI